jgi:hypothetical protein
VVALCACLVFHEAKQASAQELAAAETEYVALQRSVAEARHAVETKLRGAGDAALADKIAAAAPTVPKDRLFLPRPSSSRQFALLTADKRLAAWIEARRGHADAFFALARKAVEADQGPLGYECLWRALCENPDHAAARAALGFYRRGDQWLTKFAARQFDDGLVWNARFGWIKPDELNRHENGERRLGVRWISAEQDARRHADIRRGWKIETERFVVTTNHSLEEGARLAAELDRLESLWRRALADYWLDGPTLRRQIIAAESGTPSDADGKKHAVVYFRDREEYIRTLRPMAPGVEISLGYYHDRGRTAYFFAGEDQHPGTIYHEATHQLFKETRRTVPRPGRRDNFWIVEAIACYFESIDGDERGDFLGGRDAGRLPAARERIQEGFYVPFRVLVAYSPEQLLRDPNVAKIYSQSAGQAAFFMHADNGRRRATLARYLQSVYDGKATAATLADLFETDYDQLDAQYRRWIAAEE